ncbi:MAG: membrane protein insertion efficiency factor YidD [Puniceicoccales bacterium]|nr:membrane protein insertion efficiency factor YidD [Puniceicoccales bacterium]
MSIFGHVARALICAYRHLLSPVKAALFGNFARCRFSPTCSQFAHALFGRYNFPKALYLSTRRILRCSALWRRRRRVTAR